MNATTGAQGALSPSIATPGKSRLAVLVCFLVTLVDGYDTLMLAFVAPAISEHFAMPRGAIGKLFSAGYAGAAIGALGVGAAADRWGRKKMMIVSLLIAGLFTLLGAWAGSPTELMICRLLGGISVAIPLRAWPHAWLPARC
jgi:AAHS family 4-hydroxybenzoate transporter-like MFS transporter